jgi:hypothetical protein
MSRRVSLIAAGTAAFAVFLVAMIPAVQLSKRLPAGYAMTGVEGTIWSGQAAEFRIDGQPVGAFEWFCRPWHLVMLRWSCRATLQPRGGQFTADLSGGFRGDGLEATNIHGQSPIAAFEGIATPSGWTGRLELDIERIRIVDRRAGEATGKMFVRELRAPGAGGAELGDFELVVGEGAVGTDRLTGRLSDLGGPLRVRVNSTREKNEIVYRLFTRWKNEIPKISRIHCSRAKRKFSSFLQNDCLLHCSRENFSENEIF